MITKRNQHLKLLNTTTCHCYEKEAIQVYHKNKLQELNCKYTSFANYKMQCQEHTTMDLKASQTKHVLSIKVKKQFYFENLHDKSWLYLHLHEAKVLAHLKVYRYWMRSNKEKSIDYS